MAEPARLPWDAPEAFALTAPPALPAFRSRRCAKAAAAAAAVHPRIADWICAAPIIAVRAEPAHYQALFDLARARGKAIDAVRIVGLPTPMRKETCAQADLWARLPGWRAAFPYLSESELAQTLARWPDERRAEACRQLNFALAARPPATPHAPFARWAVRAITEVAASHSSWLSIRCALDFMASNPFDLAWSRARFEREHARWVETLAAEADAAKAVKAARAQAALDLDHDPAPFPRQAQIGLASVTALTTERALLEEGRAMRHCVGGPEFRRQLREGRAFFFHLEAGEERSTLQIGRVAARFGRVAARFVLAQHCGFANGRPHEALRSAAELLRAVGQIAADDPPTEQQP